MNGNDLFSASLGLALVVANIWDFTMGAMVLACADDECKTEDR